MKCHSLGVPVPVSSTTQRWVSRTGFTRIQTGLCHSGQRKLLKMNNFYFKSVVIHLSDIRPRCSQWPWTDYMKDFNKRFSVSLCEIILENWLDVPRDLRLELGDKILPVFVYKPATQRPHWTSPVWPHLRTVLARMVLQDLRYLSGQQRPALLRIKFPLRLERVTWETDTPAPGACRPGWSAGPCLQPATEYMMCSKTLSLLPQSWSPSCLVLCWRWRRVCPLKTWIKQEVDLVWEPLNLSSPSEEPRSRLGGTVPVILYSPTASTLGRESSTFQVLVREKLKTSPDKTS